MTQHDSLSRTGLSRLRILFITTMLFGGLSATYPASGQSGLSKEVQADLLRKQIERAYEANDSKALIEALGEHRRLGVPFPTPYLYVEARAYYRAAEYVRAYRSLTAYLKAADRNSPTYAKAIDLYSEYEARADSASGGWIRTLTKLVGTWEQRLACQDSDWSYSYYIAVWGVDEHGNGGLSMNWTSRLIKYPTSSATGPSGSPTQGNARFLPPDDSGQMSLTWDGYDGSYSPGTAKALLDNDGTLKLLGMQKYFKCPGSVTVRLRKVR